MVKELTLNKVAAALVGAAMVTGLAFAFTASRAHAVTLSELVELFIALEVIPADKADEARTVLAGQDEEESTSGSSVSCNFTRNLTVGDTGADVMDLQKLLNSKGYTVAASGTGSAGMESGDDGPATKAAAAKMQEAFAADILTPLGLTTGTGFFGASTRAKANTLCTAAEEPGTPEEPGDDEEEEAGEEEEEESGELSGEADLDSFEIDDADESDVQEGDEDAEVAEITVEFKDGDAEISRLDIAFTDSEGTDSDAWDVFESFSLWVDGEMIAEASASDEDDYLGDEDLGVIRFSGLDLVGMEDEEVVITVAATINDDLEAAELGERDVDGVAMRYFDADDVATTEIGTPVTDDTATFNVEVEGAGGDMDLKSSSADPDSSTIALDEDNTEEASIFYFTLDAEDSDGDITLENLTMNLEISSTTRALNEVVKDVSVEIDGATFSAEDFDGGEEFEAVDFDINGDVVVDAEGEVEVVVVVEFEDMDGDSDLQGVQVRASTTLADIDAEGDSGETVTIGGSDQTGEWHTLRSEGLVLELTSVDQDEEPKDVSGSTRDYGVFVYKFDVTAFGEDFYIDEDADVIDYDILVGGTPAVAASSTATLDISGAEDAATSDFVIEEGETASFTLTVETTTYVTGSTKAVVNSVLYSAADDGSEELSVDATPEDDWTSESLILN